MTDPRIRRACVMGHPVAHSRSPLIHNYWLKQLGIEGAYDFMDVAPDAFAGFVREMAKMGYVGGNVTLPHKEAAYRLAERRDEASEAVGALNVLWLENGRLMGGNSDVPGFLANLDEQAPGWQTKSCRALLLGAGGAARSATYALRQRGVEVDIANRSRERAQELAARFGAQAHGMESLPSLLRKADLLVNCTSLGMQGKPPLDLDLAPLKRGAVVCDVIYVPLETALLRQARHRGHRVVDGLGMLLHQAGYGFRKWFGGNPQVTPELRALVEADLARASR
jgi:shikimate dehydrogenase